MSQRIRVVARAWAVVLLGAALAPAAEPAALRQVDDSLIVRVIFHGKGGDFPANLIVDLGMKPALLIQQNVAEGLADGHNPKLALSLCDAADKPVARLDGLLTYTKPQVDDAARLTRQQAAALRQVPVVGFIGLGAFPGRVIEADPPAGVLRLDPPDAAGSADDVVADFKPVNAGLQLFPRDAAADAPRVVLATHQFESLALSEVVARHALGTDHATPLPLGPIDVARYSAVRPFTMPPGITATQDVVLGVQAVTHFRVTVDLPRQTVRLHPVVAPTPVADEQIALNAIAAGQGGAIEQYLRTHADTWLWHGAASALFKMRLDAAPAGPADMDTAVGFYAHSMIETERAADLVALADYLTDTKMPKYAHAIDAILSAAAAATDKDPDGRAVFAVNARRGAAALEAGDLKQARRLLMSAAFGLPRDARVRLWLGRLYERTGQPARAWSQYAKAALSDTPPDDAAARLNFLSTDEAFRATFHAADAELLLEGVIPSFASSRARSPDERPTARLVERFADSSKPKDQTPELAFSGLRDYFVGTPVVLLTYHVDPALGNDAAKARHTYYGDAAPREALRIDGRAVEANPANAATPAKQFAAWLPRLLQAPPDDAPVLLAVTASTVGDSTKVVVTGLRTDPGLRLHVMLVERCVLAMTGDGLPLHYGVVRRALTPGAGRVIDAGRVELTADPRQTADPSEGGAGGGLDAVLARSDYVDVRELSAVAFVQDAATHAVRGIATVPLAVDGTGGEQ